VASLSWGRSLLIAATLLAHGVGCRRDAPAPEPPAVTAAPPAPPPTEWHAVAAPVQLRFSADGKQLVVASNAEDSVSVVERASGRVRRFDVDEDVNDATFLDGRPGLIAWADDADRICLFDVGKRQLVFSTDAVTGDAATRLFYQPGVPLLRRDQNAVAYLPATGVLLAGGDDNRLWRIRLAGERYEVARPVEVDANVDEIVPFDDERVIVALDSLALLRARPDGPTSPHGSSGTGARRPGGSGARTASRGRSLHRLGKHSATAVKGLRRAAGLLTLGWPEV